MTLSLNGGLPAADDEGTSDAYVTVRMAGQMAKTDTIWATCFPRWYQTLELNVSVATNQVRLSRSKTEP